MSELRPILDREALRVSAAPGALERVLNRVERRRRNRRVGTAVLALVLAAAAIGTLIRVFDERGAPAGPPPITPKNVADLRLSWSTAPGGCCPMPAVVGDTAYVGWNDGITAYPAYCGYGGSGCKPLWVGSVKGVSNRPKTSIVDYNALRLGTPVVGDGMVFAADKRRVYAFRADCAAGGATCQPSWIARPPTPRYGLSLPAVGEGLVLIGAGDGHLYAYPTHCGTSAMKCAPTWRGKGDGQAALSGGVVYTSDAHNVYAYSVACVKRGTVCKPLWSGPIASVQACCYSPPVVANGLVYVGAGKLVYGFRTSCATTGGVCHAAWIAATGEPGAGVISWTVDGSTAFVGTTRGGQVYAGSGHVYAFSTDCGTVICRPLWSVRLDADPYLTAHNGLLFVATHGGFLAVYPYRCGTGASTCKPIWTAATPDGGLPFAPPVVTDNGVFSEGDTGRMYAFTVSEEART